MANPDAEANNSTAKEAPAASADAKENKAAAEGKPQTENKTESKVENKAENKTENKAENKVENKAENKTENKTEATDAAAPAAGDGEAVVDAAALNVDELAKEGNLFDPNKMGILNDVSILLTIEVGRTQIKIRDLLNLAKGSIVELNKLAGDPVDIYANGKLISTGNIITANGKYCVRLISIPDNNKMGAKTNGK